MVKNTSDSTVPAGAKELLDALLSSLDSDKIDRYPSDNSSLESQIISSATRLTAPQTELTKDVAEIEKKLNAITLETRDAAGLVREIVSGRVVDAEAVCALLIVYCSVATTADGFITQASLGREVGASDADTRRRRIGIEATTVAATAREITKNCARLLGGTALMEFLIKQRRAEVNEPIEESLDIVWGLMSVLGVKFVPRICRIPSSPEP